MTRPTLADLDLYASRVQKYYETYKNYETTIQSELSAANASQQQYEDEAEETRQMDEDVEEAKSVTRLKRNEWDLIEKKENKMKLIKEKQRGTSQCSRCCNKCRPKCS
jgi:hypothetical protein